VISGSFRGITESGSVLGCYTE